MVNPRRLFPPKAKVADIQEVFRVFKAADPAPLTELLYNNPYQLLVAVVLSAQATDKAVNLATAPLFAKVSSPEDMIKLGEGGLIPYIQSIGLFRTKAKNVIALSHILAGRDGRIPDNEAELTSLPGVGRKTANVVLNQIFGHPTIAVDTHVFRVAQRLGLSRGSSPDAVERDLLRVIPQEFLQHAHHWLILHGRYTCIARNPRCRTCPIQAWCHSPEKTI